ncbi:hypothetical protein HPC62_16135 [Thermoleptolyngbya sichuanensis A183]|uniref:Uncharacterized protein n=1 Tax=Thermoleptolyngbya sichuanensis A183 TaxID=2737172 RepID=A0A6M8BBN8_9CYAN|nr:hypothetical protein [Thermoleptolyngbya sichuanensis]QKD83522.1 hypothetical protein HPC62_16135 [Thermoleptolyngbya sichuanensis A183]
MNFYGGDAYIDPDEYLTDEPPTSGYWQGLQDIAPGFGQAAPPREVPARPVPRDQIAHRERPSLPSPNFGAVFMGLTNGFMRHYPKLFFIVIVPASMVALGTLVLSGNQIQEAAITTPLAAQSKQVVYDAAVGIVLDQPIQTTEGVRPATAAEILDAGRRVMGEMESQLLQRKVNEWFIGITLGMATPGHPCYQLTQEQCVAWQQRTLDERWQAATQVGNTDELLLISSLNRALDRIRENRTEPHQWQPDLWRFARVKYLNATQQLDAQTPNGVANTFMKMKQPAQQQAGMQYNPQTRQLEPLELQP